MKHPLDNQTQDWCEEAQPHLSLSKSMLKFDRVASFMSKAVHKKGRVSSKDFMDFTGSGLRSAQRDLKALSKMGYLTTDECMPKGYLPTEKAKMIFGGAK